jgi:hypothetical protein
LDLVVVTPIQCGRCRGGTTGGGCIGATVCLRGDTVNKVLYRVAAAMTGLSVLSPLLLLLGLLDSVSPTLKAAGERGDAGASGSCWSSSAVVTSSSRPDQTLLLRGSVVHVLDAVSMEGEEVAAASPGPPPVAGGRTRESSKDSSSPFCAVDSKE